MSRTYRGGVLLTALLFVMLFSFLFSLVVEEAQLTHRFSIKTQDFYSAKIIYSIFCMEVEQAAQPLPQKGAIHYSEGELSYSVEGEHLVTDILVNQKKYQFKKNYSPNKRKNSR